MAIVKGSKKGKNKARQPLIAPDSAQSKTYINILYGLAEGEVEGLSNGNKSIFLEETPLEDGDGNPTYSNVKVDFRKGTNDQEYIEGFPFVESETAVGVELKSDIPWVRAFNNIELDAVRIRLKFGPLRKQDATSGDVSGLTIEYAIDVQTDGGTWTEVLKAKISDKTSANYERAHRIDLPRADSSWLVRVRRLTPNSSSEYISDKMYIDAVTEVVDAKLRYPNTALLGLRYDAETFGNVAKVAVDLKGTLVLVPSNYDAETRIYTGIWDGTFKRAYTNNPAWIYYDLCTNDRYGLGSRLTPLMVDKWSLYRLAQYCDEMVPDGQGGQEPRFTCNVYLQSASEAFSILTKLAGVFRAIAFWDGTNIHCDADIPQDTFFTYSRANVIGGQFEYSGTRARDRHNVVKIAWDNPANHYKTEYEYVRDEQAIAESGQVRILELDAWGCTSRGQAQRAGHWALKSEQKETRTVSFKVGLDGHIPLPGRVIEIADELFAGRANGGRVSKISADLTKITLDREDVVAKAGDRLVINGENGKAQTRIVQSISGRVVTVTLPFDENSIAVQNVWVLDAQDLATMKFRVISLSQDEKHQFSVTALQYNPQKFDEIDKGAFFEDAPISIINPSIQEPVKDVLITTESRVDQGINLTTMIVTWTQAKGAVKYLVEWRKDNGSWIQLPQTGNNSVEVPGVYSGQYQARVTAISAFEIASLPTSSILTDITGKQGLPPKLEFIRATGILFGMKLDWGFPPTGAKDTAFTEIEVSADGVTNIAQLGLFAFPTTTHTIQGLQPNLTQFYRGRLIDRIGNVGPWSEWGEGTTIADPDIVLDLISGHISETDLAQELQGKIENSANVAEAAQTAANNAKAAADNAQTAATDAQTAAANAQTSANEAASVASKTASDLKSATDQLNKEISDEANARIADIAQLNDGLTAETTQRKSEDAALLSNIETYKSSTNGTLSSLQEQITTNATNTSANASKISSLDSRLTTNEGKTAEAINSAATAQQTANTAVTNAAAAASAVTSLKSELSTGKGVNNIIAPFSDPQELSPYLTGANRTVALVKSPMRINGKAYDVTFNAVAGNIYFGSSSNATVNTTAAGTITGGKRYMFSAYLKNLDATKQAEVNFMIYWFRRTSGSISITQASLINQTTNITRITPSNDGGTISFKSVTAPSDAFAFIFLCSGNGVYNVAGSRILIDMLMLEEVVGVDVPASTWTAGPTDLSAIKSALDANASAISKIDTRVTNAEGTITSQGNSITQLNNSVTTINGVLTNKADNSALQALDSKVSNIDGQTALNTSSITSLSSTLNSATSSITMNAGNVLTDWILEGLVPEYKVVSEETAKSGKVLQLGDNANNDQFWGRANNLISFDENKTYRLQARYRRKSGAGSIFLGVAQLTVDKSSYITDTNLITNSMASSNYTIAGHLPAIGEWQEVVCYLKGRSTGAATGAGTINNPRNCAKQTYFISPVFIGNYNNVAGIVELDYLILEDAEAIVGNFANANAINTLTTNVSNINDQVTTNTNSITSLSSRVINAEGDISIANDAISSLSTRISEAEGELKSQSNSVTQLSDQIGNTKSYSIVTFRNGSAVGMPKDNGIHSYKGKINGFGRGLNLIVFNNGNVVSCTMYDTYGYMESACQDLNNAIQGLNSGTYFAIVGTDNIGSVAVHGAAENLRATLLACGASRSYLNTWVGNSLPIFVGRKDLDAGNGILGMFDSSVMNQWIEYPLTFIGGVPTGMGDARAITTLLDANASAISSLSNTVTQQGNDLISHSNSLTSLSNSLALSGKAGANLLIKSNVMGTYNGIDYPHVVYAMGEEWEVGAKYTLLWCAEHKRGAGDTNSSLWAYAGGGLQGLQGIENTNGKIVNKVTFTKDGGPDGKYVNFYMINPPTADKNSIGTVYWAVLVKGDLITTDAWVPSAYDYLPDTKANSTALNSLDSKVANIDGRVSSNSNAITSLNSRIATAEGNITSNANAIANTYTKAQTDSAIVGQVNSFKASLQVAGTNLLRNGNFADDLSNWAGWGGTSVVRTIETINAKKWLHLVANNTSIFRGVSQTTSANAFKRNTEYTISFNAYSANATAGISVIIHQGGDGNNDPQITPTISITNKNSRYSFTFKSADLDTKTAFNFMIGPQNEMAGDIYITDIMFAEGNVASAWAPSNDQIMGNISANADAINSLSSRVTTTEGNIASQSSSITSLTNQIGNTKSYSIVTFRNGSAIGMPKDGGIHSFKGKISGFGRGLNLIVFNNGDVASCTAYDTYGDIIAGCNAIYAAINALASGTYFAIVGTDNIGAVGDSNPNTDLRALLLACGAGDRYFRSWNWNALPIFVGRKDLDAGNGILGMFDSTIGNQWIEYPLTFVNGAPMGMGDARNVTAQLDANAAAISSLSNTVTQQGNDIISHSNALTSLSASVSGIYKEIQLSDTRNDNQPPAWYWQNHGLKIVREFKLASTLGLSGLMPDTYVTLETQVPWVDPSGGPIIQIARGYSSAFTAERRSADYNSWFAWSQDIKALSDGLSNKAEASALSSLDAKVSTIDGKVSTQATSITNLQTTVGGHTASIQSQQQSIDGLKSRATLKLQSGNLIGGVGIENDSKTVDFIIQANKFAIAPPSDAAAGSVAPKYAFVYQPTATTLPNGTVVPAGLYLDNASIGYINAEKINASSLSAISANLGTLTTLKDPTKPNGARMVITGSLTTVYDDNNVARIRLGIW